MNLEGRGVRYNYKRGVMLIDQAAAAGFAPAIAKQQTLRNSPAGLRLRRRAEARPHSARRVQSCRCRLGATHQPDQFGRLVKRQA